MGLESVTETAVIVSGVIIALSILLWAFAFYKAMTLWKDKKKRLLFGITILMGICSAGTDYAFVYLLLDERPFLQKLPEYMNSTIVQAIFYGLYHTLFLYIKILRLNLTKRIANKNISNALIILSVIYYLSAIGYCLCYLLTAFDATYEWAQEPSLKLALSGFAVIEIFLGTIVELATVTYLYHVFSYKQNGKKSRFGPFEYFALVLAIFAIACTILGPLLYVDSFFWYLQMSSFFWFQSVTCCSLVSSVETAKDQAKQRSVAISNSVQKSSQKSQVSQMPTINQ